jgi:hypothetical protein
MQSVISNGSVASFHIEIGPSRWDRAFLDVRNGSAMLMNSLRGYEAHCLVRNSGSCPGDTLITANKTDITLSNGVVMKHVPWETFPSLMAHMASKNYDCNFWFTKQPMTKLVIGRPLHNSETALGDSRFLHS